MWQSLLDKKNTPLVSGSQVEKDFSGCFGQDLAKVQLIEVEFKHNVKQFGSKHNHDVKKK